MATAVLRKIAGDLQSTEFISILMDECTELANHEQVNKYCMQGAYGIVTFSYLQVVVALSWVDDELLSYI